MNGRRKTIGAQRILIGWIFSVFSLPVFSQAAFHGYEHLFTAPKSYVVHYTTEVPTIDGNISDPAWNTATWTEEFEDIEGSKRPAPAYKTRAKMLWSDSCLLIAAELEDPHVWATLTRHDAIIYYDNDFEVFIDPANNTHQYFEVEVNALNTILDLFMPKPYRNGGAAMLSYNMTGLQSAVTVMGSLNDPADKDKGWTVEMAIPFRAIYIGNQWRPPAEGALWRINFSRVQWQTEIVNGKYVKKKGRNGRPLPEDNWVWSPQGVINMHLPERWGYLQFTKEKSGRKGFVLPVAEKRKQYLWLLYYKQKAFFGKNQRYATSLQDLGLTDGVLIDGTKNSLHMEATTRQFSGYITDQNTTLSINDEGFVRAIKN